MRLVLVFGLMLSSFAQAKVPHDYIVEFCDSDENMCVILSQQGGSHPGFIATEDTVELVKNEGVKMPMVAVSRELYDSISEDLERYDINSFFEEDDDFLDSGVIKTRNTVKKLKRIYDEWQRSGGGGEGKRGNGRRGEGRRKKCGDCHTGGRHKHHPPT